MMIAIPGATRSRTSRSFMRLLSDASVCFLGEAKGAASRGEQRIIEHNHPNIPAIAGYETRSVIWLANDK
jgi:hypothetical protein